jgi:ABC-type glycerol-3-phosphate transport system substrate-binding protein
MTRTLRFPAILLSAAFIAAACSGGGGGSSSAPAASEPGASASGGASGGPVTSGAAGEINVLSLWGGSEEEAFKKVLADFTAKTGWGVKYEADRQTYSTTLQSRITGGNPPDIAIIPGIGFLRRFAKDGSLKKISDLGVDASTLTQDYPEGFLAAAPSTASCTPSRRSTTTRARCGSGPTSTRPPTSPRRRRGTSTRRCSRRRRDKPVPWHNRELPPPQP